LLSKGVDGFRSHAYSANRDIAGLENYTLLNLAQLSGDVVSFLIGHGHLPSHQNLLCKAVGYVVLNTVDASAKDRMATDRLSILQQLVAAGLVIADSATEVMKGGIELFGFYG
jgi:hypothetical protein